jgi:hypothetical protein
MATKCPKGAIAVLFSPTIPFHMNRNTWGIVDIVVAIVFLVSLPFIKSRKLKENP